MGTVPVVIDDDVETAAAPLRATFARFVGPMGATGRNFHFNAWARMGHEGEATRVRELWKDGRTAEAAASIPLSVIEELALVGPVAKIREEIPAWRGSLLTTLVVHVAAEPAALRQVAELVLG